MDELTLNTGLGSGQNISATLSGSQNSNQSVFRNFDDLFILSVVNNDVKAVNLNIQCT